jgi:hypothetical protein
MSADYFLQPRAVAANDSGREHGSGHVYASDGISRGLPCICRLWTSAYTLRHLFITDLVPALALASNDASLSRPIS